MARHAPIAAPPTSAPDRSIESWHDHSSRSDRSAPYERASGKGSKKSDCGKGEGSSKGKVKGYSTKKEAVTKAVEGAIADISSAVKDAIHTVQSQQAPDQRQLPSPFQIALPGAGSDIGGQKMVQVPMKDLQLLHASLGRAFFAASNGHQLMAQLAEQFESEAKVIGQAKTIVENILATRHI